MNSKRPLVTVCMMTYNQENYVRDSVLGVLAQTYEPLEIVISDDCSMDRTWDIVLEEVDNYMSQNGRHNVVVSRNQTNLGIARHYEKVVPMMHGQLIIGNAGDDISDANRVEKIVDCWMQNGCSATIITHYARVIDLSGRVVGTKRNHGPWYPFGAANAYARCIYEKFPPVSFKGAFEDWVYSLRAIMLGGYICIPEELLSYRFGSGISTDSRSFEKVCSLNAHMTETFRQMLMDIDYAEGHIPHVPIHEYRNKVTRALSRNQNLIILQSNKNLMRRFRAFRCLQRLERGGTRVFLVWFLYVILGCKAWSIIQMVKKFSKAEGGCCG